MAEPQFIEVWLPNAGGGRSTFEEIQTKAGDYTTQDSDHLTLIRLTGTGAQEISLHNDAPVGTCIAFRQVAGGEATKSFVAVSGATIVMAEGYNRIYKIGAGAVASVDSNDDGVSAVWVLEGNMI